MTALDTYRFNEPIIARETRTCVLLKAYKLNIQFWKLYQSSSHCSARKKAFELSSEHKMT